MKRRYVGGKCMILRVNEHFLSFFFLLFSAIFFSSLWSLPTCRGSLSLISHFYPPSSQIEMPTFEPLLSVLLFWSSAPIVSYPYPVSSSLSFSFSCVFFFSIRSRAFKINTGEVVGRQGGGDLVISFSVLSSFLLFLSSRLHLRLCTL